MNANTLWPDELSQALHRGIGSGALSWGQEAATLLLIRHGYWMDCQEFRAHLEIDGEWNDSCSALINWATACHIPNDEQGPRVEDDVLRLACHLAGEIPDQASGCWSISAVLAFFDARTTLLAIRAVAMSTLGPHVVPTLE